VFYKNFIVENDGPEYSGFLKYSGKDSVSSYEILKEMSSLFENGDYADLKAEVTEYEGSSVLKLIKEKNPDIKNIELFGITIINKKLADSIVSELTNNPFNGKKLSKKIIDILSIYRKDGYSLAELEMMNFYETTGQLELYFDEGMISEISIEGNTHTNPTIITREFPLEAGEYFYYGDVEKGLINLRSTNLFDDIVLTVKEEDERNIIVLKVLEKISSLLRFGFRIDNEKRAQASLDLRDENLFGSGTELGLLLFGGTRNRAYVLEHKSNRIFDTYFTYKINAFYKFDDVFVYKDDPSTSDRRYSRSIAGEYRQIYYGASVSMGTQVERFGNLIFMGKYQFDEIINKQSELIDPYKWKIVSLKISTTIDTQDKYPYPDYGFYFYGSYETAQKVLGGDIGFTNVGFDYKYYFTFEQSHTFSPRISMGFADKTLPLSQQYSLGGQNSFFGMRADEYRGRQIFLSSIEYRYMFPINIFFETYVKLRYDLGSIWDEQEKIRFKDLRHGVGITLSFDTPIGPADFSVGRSFIFKSNLPGSPISRGDIYFYFSIGYYY
jgi:NTE family protein